MGEEEGAPGTNVSTPYVSLDGLRVGWAVSSNEYLAGPYIQLEGLVLERRVNMDPSPPERIRKYDKLIFLPRGKRSRRPSWFEPHVPEKGPGM